MEKLCIYGCGRKALYQIKNGNWICEKFCSQCPENRKKNSLKIKELYQEGRLNCSHIKKGIMQGWQNKTEEEIKAIHKKQGETYSKNIREGLITPSFLGKKHTRAIIEKLSQNVG